MGDYEREERVREERDRLSELPESVILHILSFLPISDVVSTTLLSKGWNNLWTTIPCLDFSEIVGGERTRNFVNGALRLWKGTTIQKFKIRLQQFDCSMSGDVSSWVQFVVENEVKELDISLTYEIEDHKAVENGAKDAYMAPQCLNSCAMIRELSLVGCNLQIPGFPTWNQLKSLRIDGFYYSESMISGILLGSPRLEVFELNFLENNESLNIQSTSLKKLKIFKDLYSNYDDAALDSTLRINCANLESLELSGILYSEYWLEDVSSVIDVTLHFDDSHLRGDAESVNEYQSTKLRDLFSFLPHVERVTLWHSCVQVLFDSKYPLTPLTNVKFLKLKLFWIEMDQMMGCLANFPNLRTLVVEVWGTCFLENKSFECEKNFPLSRLPQLRTIEISTTVDSTAILLRCVEFLLKHCRVLEKLVVAVRDQACMVKLAGILRLPRASPMAQVILKTD